jgi:translation initiation factor IF-2
MKEKSNKGGNSVTLDDLFSKIESGVKEVNIVLKADVKGSEEAVKNALEKIDVQGVRTNVIRSGTGTITESDIVLANASSAIVIGFNVRPSSKTKEFAKEYNVDIRLHNIIYKVVEELEAAMKGMLDPEYEEKVLGEAEVRKLFKFSKVGTIAGSMVTSGIIRRDAKARIIRDGVVIYDGEINSIQREKDTVKEVKKGLECGITITNFSDIKVGDIIGFDNFPCFIVYNNCIGTHDIIVTDAVAIIHRVTIFHVIFFADIRLVIFDFFDIKMLKKILIGVLYEFFKGDIGFIKKHNGSHEADLTAKECKRKIIIT